MKTNQSKLVQKQKQKQHLILGKLRSKSRNIKNTGPKPKNKPPAEPDKTGEKRAQDQEVQIKEMPIAAPKKKAKNLPEKDDNAKDIMRAIKKAAKKPASKNSPQEFFIGDDASPKAQNIKRLAESGSKVPTVKRRRGRNKTLIQV